MICRTNTHTHTRVHMIPQTELSQRSEWLIKRELIPGWEHQLTPSFSSGVFLPARQAESLTQFADSNSNASAWFTVQFEQSGVTPPADLCMNKSSAVTLLRILKSCSEDERMCSTKRIRGAEAPQRSDLFCFSGRRCY